MQSNSTQRRTLADRLNESTANSSTVLQANKQTAIEKSPAVTVGVPLYNAKTDVISTLETLPDNTVKYLFRLVYVGLACGVFSLAFLVVCKMKFKSYLRGRSVLIWNTAIASCGILALGFSFLRICYRLYLVNSKRLRWSARRRKAVTLFMTELSVQLINLVFYLAPNVYLLKNECGWNDQFLVWAGFGRMTCWNTIFLVFLIISHNTNLIEGESGRPDAAVFDAPFSFHAPKLLLWLTLEGTLIGISIRSHNVNDPSETACTDDELFECGLDKSIRYLTYFVSFLFIVYLIGSTTFLKIGFQQLNEKQYLCYRMANIQIRLQASQDSRQLFMLSILCLSSCCGFLPSQLATTIALFVKSYLIQPVKPTNEDRVLEMWLREFAWSEDEIPSLLEQRGNGCCLKSAPLFCFESSVKTFYWSAFVYDIQQIQDSSFTLKTAMRLYGITDYKLFHERLHDTKLIVAWNDSMILLTFRGTSSLKNVFADLRIARIIHPPTRGNALARPRVHRGFLETWHSNGLNLRVLEHVTNLMKDKSRKIMCTGHSLGGALAILAAYDIAKHCEMSPCQIECYTFGAPRVGNYAFANDYAQHVPSTWNVINDQDYVTRTMKFVMLYKRPGHRVLINSHGDMLVRPSFIEMTLSRTTGAVNITHHFLSSYQRALLSIARSQFNPDGLEGGAEQMLKISETLRQVLGVSKTRLIQELSWGGRLRKLEKKKKLEEHKFKYLRKSVEVVVDSVRDFAMLLKYKLETVGKLFQTANNKSMMEGINPSTTRVCGRMNCEEMDVESCGSNGIFCEVGHVSLVSQRTENPVKPRLATIEVIESKENQDEKQKR